MSEHNTDAGAAAEAWELLSKKDLGLRDRMTKMRDSLFRREVLAYTSSLRLHTLVA